MNTISAVKVNSLTMSSFEDNILLKLRRQYSDVEAVKLALLELDKAKVELSKERVENGKLKAEIAYLESIKNDGYVMKRDYKSLQKAHVKKCKKYEELEVLYYSEIRKRREQ